LNQFMCHAIYDSALRCQICKADRIAALVEIRNQAPGRLPVGFIAFKMPD